MIETLRNYLRIVNKILGHKKKDGDFSPLELEQHYCALGLVLFEMALDYCVGMATSTRRAHLFGQSQTTNRLVATVPSTSAHKFAGHYKAPDTVLYGSLGQGNRSEMSRPVPSPGAANLRIVRSTVQRTGVCKFFVRVSSLISCVLV